MLERAATDTGSIPTGIESVWVSKPAEIEKTSRRLSGVLTASSVVPSGETVMGLTWPLSKVIKDGWAETDVGAIEATRTAIFGIVPSVTYNFKF